MRLRVLPPDVNQSQVYFTPSNGDIRYGLAAIRNVGEGAVQQIIRARTEQGPIESFTDFCRKVDPGVLHKKVVESLILAGAFDSLGYVRRGLLESYQKVVDPILADRRAEATGQESFFGGEVAPALDIDEAILAGEEFEKADLLRQEKDMLGQYVTDHPLLAIRERLSEQTDMDVSELAALGDGDVVTVAGIVVAVGRKYTKRGEPYAVLRLEDLTGGVGVVAFPSVFEKSETVVSPDAIVLVKGRADLRGRELQLVALEIREPDLSGVEPPPLFGRASTDPSDPLLVDVSASSCTRGLIARMKDVFSMHPGGCPVLIQLVSDGGTTRLRLAEEYRVDGSSALLGELRRLLGPGAVRFHMEEAAASVGPRP